ncbi:MAG TPA: beta-propeller fold lactonase family protein [Anaerolineales bacterium]|nr:beta-propeller fold lactonase family protein [Anaerolineales bacterium]
MKSFAFTKHLGARFILAVFLIIPLLIGFTSPVAADGEGKNAGGAVYTITNEASGNEVAVYDRSADGSLTFMASYPTGGLGSGAGLGSQGSVILRANGRQLFVVNAGSNQISVFGVRKDSLELLDVADSGGEMPISLTFHNDTLYVLNAGGSGNISGFRVRENGKLAALAGSTQPLSNGGEGDSPQPAQISFSLDGRVLVVTEKATNLIDVYQVVRGIAGPPVTHPSSGMTPFGFAFAKRHDLIVSEAFGGAPEASAVSSYNVDGDTFEVVSPSVGTTQTAACWVIVSNNGKYAYVTNAGSGSISSYRIKEDGTLILLEAQAGLTGEGSSPIDMAFSNNGQLLYALGANSDAISIFRAQGDGSLESLGSVSVPAGAVGLAAR